eukprot:jgi/Tetstr1/432764/TSEL_002326.t1
MEEAAARRARMKALREQASSGVQGGFAAANSSGAGGLANPLVDALEQAAVAPPKPGGFTFYSDPLATAHRDTGARAQSKPAPPVGPPPPQLAQLPPRMTVPGPRPPPGGPPFAWHGPVPSQLPPPPHGYAFGPPPPGYGPPPPGYGPPPPGPPPPGYAPAFQPGPGNGGGRQSKVPRRDGGGRGGGGRGGGGGGGRRGGYYKPSMVEDPWAALEAVASLPRRQGNPGVLADDGRADRPWH